jgi:nucleoside-diphosphate-sugar epimerase
MLAERLVLAANGPGFNTVALRPHLIWGPGDPHFMPRLLNRARRNALWLLKSEALVDATYIDNAALAHILALEKLAKGAPIGGRAYFIAQGEPRAAAELIGKILEAASGGRAAVRGTLPAWLGKAGGFILERMWNLLKLAGEPPLTSFVAEELTLPHWFNLEAARRDLGYDPPVSTALGLAKLAEYHRGQGAAPDFRSLSSSHAEKR